METLVGKYADVSEGSGCLPGKLHLEIDKNVTPVQHSSRKLPVALKEDSAFHPSKVDKVSTRNFWGLSGKK